VPSANGVLRPSEVFGEQDVCFRCGRWRECEQFHRLVVERRDRLVDWESRHLARQCGRTGKSDRRGGSGRMLRIVKCVREPGAPVTKVTRDDKECIFAHEVRREDATEFFLFLLVDGSNEDRDDGDFFPGREELFRDSRGLGSETQ
jgi:hypothetical protein